MDDDLFDNPTDTEIVTQPLHPPVAEWISKEYHHLSFINRYWYLHTSNFHCSNKPPHTVFGITRVHLNGGNLIDLIAATKPYPVTMLTATSIADSIATLLAELHSRQLAYGNLTPTNVILKRNLTQLGFTEGYSKFCKDNLPTFPPSPPKQNGLHPKDVTAMKEDMNYYGQLLFAMMNPQHQGHHSKQITWDYLYISTDSSASEFP